ncbi:hypothetical protein A3Q56_04533 [Intoshia linei]|uniref:Uncharacterized protein n=1 Tax=Intoshia linei TaxID=1819745 RepID=A0A177B0C3_9BILA|nr:hypothetical protein A3Q56_04533 [Intoshia linei]
MVENHFSLETITPGLIASFTFFLIITIYQIMRLIFVCHKATTISKIEKRQHAYIVNKNDNPNIFSKPKDHDNSPTGEMVSQPILLQNTVKNQLDGSVMTEEGFTDNETSFQNDEHDF